MSPLTSGRLSHSSEPLNGGSLTGTDSPPISPSDEFDDVVKVSLSLFPYLLFWVGVGPLETIVAVNSCLFLLSA